MRDETHKPLNWSPGAHLTFIRDSFSCALSSGGAHFNFYRKSFFIRTLRWLSLFSFPSRSRISSFGAKSDDDFWRDKAKV